MTKDELLAVLDLSEEEQWIWLREVYYNTAEHPDNYYSDTLADLAFRLRDEAIKNNSDAWAKACWQIHQCDSLGEIKYPNIYDTKVLMNSEYWVLTQKAIYWIITALLAALIAKEEVKNE